MSGFFSQGPYDRKQLNTGKHYAHKLYEEAMPLAHERVLGRLYTYLFG